LTKTAILSFALFLMLLFSGCGEKQDWNQDERFQPYLSPGVAAPDFMARTIENKFIPFSTYSGRGRLVTFFKKNCDECVKTLDVINNIHKKYSGRGFTSIAIDADNLSYVPSSAVIEFVKSRNLSYPVLLDDESLGIERFKVISIPVTFFIDKKGIITHIAYSEEDLLSTENTARIETLL